MASNYLEWLVITFGDQGNSVRKGLAQGRHRDLRMDLDLLTGEVAMIGLCFYRVDITQ